MSSSWNCEVEIRELARKLHSQAYELEQAADTLRILRDSEEHKNEIKKAQDWAKGWLSRS